MQKRTVIGLSVVGLCVGTGMLGGCSRSAQARDISANVDCSVVSIQAAAPADTTIISAEHLTTPISHCKVDGYVTTTDPGPNKVNFRLQLPDKALWKGRYYFIGLGGSAGYVPTNSELPPGNPMVKGFAVAGTDTGRQGNSLDWTFLADPAKALDHTHRGAHVTTVAAQQITKAYYGVEKLWRYHSGCSGGGRMGGEAAMMHPEDYDGILLGQSRVRPAGMVDSAVMLKFIHAAQQMTREPGSWLSPDKLMMVEGHVTEACDMADGAKDDVVWDHRLCKYDVAQLRCKAGDAPDCLTEPEIKSIKAILHGPRGPKGELLAEPMPITNMSVWSAFLGRNPPPWKPDATAENLAKSSAGYVIATTTVRGMMVKPDYDVLKDFHFTQKDLDDWRLAFKKGDFGRSPDLTPAEKANDKVLLWVGESDPCCSSDGMEAYVSGLGKTMGAVRVAKFIQLYRIPGLGHCGGGTGPWDAPDQLLQTLIDWVEDGKIPDGVVMHRGADRAKLVFADPAGRVESGVRVPFGNGGSRDFFVCPFPMVSVFDKSKAKTPGAVNEAINWSCRASRS